MKLTKVQKNYRSTARDLGRDALYFAIVLGLADEAKSCALRSARMALLAHPELRDVPESEEK